MVRFSCFSSHLHNHRPKKGAQQYSRQIYSGEMHMDPARLPQDEVSKASPNSGFSNVKMEDCNLSSSTTEQLTSPTSFGCCKSEGFNTNSPVKDGKEIHQVLRLKKSQSLGSGLDRGGCSCDAYVEDALSEKLSFENPDEKDGDTVLDSFNEYAPIELYNNLGPGNKFSEPNQLHTQGHSFVENLDLQHDSLFSVGHVKQFEAHLHEDSCGHSYSEHADMGNINFSAPPTISKSCSLPSFDICLFNNGCEPSAHDFGGRSRSFENLCMKDVGKFNGQERFQISCQPNEASVDGLPKTPSSNLAENRSSCPADLVEDHILSGSQCYSREVPDQDTDEAFCHETSRCEDHPDITYDSHSLNGLVDNWRESEIGDNVQEELSLHKWNELTGKDFHMRRIEDWLSQIDIQDNRPIEEVGECSNSVPKMKDSHLIDSSAAVRPDARGSPGMEAAYNYISSLTPISTSAQMTNLGLAVIPLLGAFSGLRMLNLSGNFIVKITTGALPRGLHALNLSRNNITIIEGLRELTRLRVLDLSYNRILRIGHGLSACSSLKELYLVGNKISEVEGLHRLLKLTVLDLSFNKISTAKCLGQLAANYSSLQAINLEGNPAQRNVGDEQLKRYLLSLLPNLVYFNRHAIRTKSSKEISDRSARSGTFDRSLRSEQKRSRRGHNSASSHKSTTLSNHGKSSQSISTLIKPSRGLHGHAMLPPLGSKPSHQNLPSIGAKLVSLRSSPIRRSRSEGNFT